LYKYGYLQRNITSKKYTLGYKFLEQSKNILEGMDLRNTAHPHLKNLRDSTQETVHLMLYEDCMGVYIDAIESLYGTRVVSHIGTKDDLHYSAVGKAILAYLPEEEVTRIIAERGLVAKAPNTITNYRDLKNELERIRKQKFSIDNEEGEIGTRCIGAPIFNHAGKAVASISVAAPSHRMTDAAIKKFSRLVIKTAALISQTMGKPLTKKE
jgi:IclR family acetate operon transcriptional repressor